MAEYVEPLALPLSRSYSTISLVRAVADIAPQGSWPTKSGGLLTVNFALPNTGENSGQIMGDFDWYVYPSEELELFQKLTGGFDPRTLLRCYAVTNLSKGKIGGTEFHRLRQELVFCPSGRVEWECEDLTGEKEVLVLSRSQGVYTPPFTLHTYRTLEDNSALVVVCNTLMDPARRETSDTYSRETFQKMQEQVANKK